MSTKPVLTLSTRAGHGLEYGSHTVQSRLKLTVELTVQSTGLTTIKGG